MCGRLMSEYTGIVLKNNSLLQTESICFAVTDSNTDCFVFQVFGFLSLFLWAVNIFWVIIDTPWYIQRKGNSDGEYEQTP